MEKLSNRAQNLVKDISPILSTYMFVKLNEYDDIKNPNGICNLGVAENQLTEDLLTEKIKSIQTWKSDYNYYPNSQGELNLRQELCQFFHHVFQLDNHVKLLPEQMLISAGASGTLSLICYMVADIGDVILTTSPYYTAFDFDINALTQNTIFRCPLLDQDKGLFCLNVDVYRYGYEKALEQGFKPKALIIVNPQNPTGDIYDEDIIRPVLEFAYEMKLHVIVDEIYALSLFQTSITNKFQSILNYKSIPDPERTHFLWSFSKDFSMSGIRIGVVYTDTTFFCPIAKKINFLMTPSISIQETITTLIKDKQWLNYYIEINQKRLTQQYLYVKQQIELISQHRIKIYESKAGFFIWADFRSILKEITIDEELKLFQIIFNSKLYIACGYNLGCIQPGWFRIIFSLKQTWIDEGLKRLKLALDIYENNI
ncbi:unnamed protein product [Didymodactylos carnosus]|uniref:Aminotransferase class I/classII large domain-containing protein n=1 Tax=Didymodactylos carnosus TaxID=1234261 RepID=A0A8S2HVA2_9BILA|nr:unnamed protein product [Didymodactylos carnosus]CAF3682200.1 unnamed protein product [Didymodactylos carnosus]